jgi:hypothetical protein
VNFIRPVAAGAFLACLLVVGCSRFRPDHLSAHPTSGSLFVSGKPAGGARVVLFAIGNARLEKLGPHAEVEADGSFRITTYMKGDGAPEGTYALTITWPLPPPRGKELGKDRLRGKYADPRQPARQVNIVAGDNVLEPIRLP